MDYIEIRQRIREGAELHLAGNLEEAEQKYRQILADNDANAAIHNNLGFLLSQRGAIDEAIREYNRAIEIDPGYATAHFNLGQLFLVQLQWDKAEQSILKALELSPEDFNANKTIAKLYVAKKDMVNAEMYFRRSYQLQPKSELLTDLAWCLLAQQKHEEAANILGYAEDAERKNPRYYTLWGIIHYSTNNFGLAIYYFRQSLGLEPENVETRSSLAACLLKAGNTEEASVEMQRILILQPGHIESLNNLAVLEMAAGHSDLSAQHLDKVLSQEPENGKALFYKAMICYQKEKKEEAIQLLRSLDGFVDSPYAARAREALEFLTDPNK